MALRIALAQINTAVGDIKGNLEKMRDFYSRALEQNVNLIVFPELSICGYPPEDLLHKEHFLQDNKNAIEALAAECPDMTVVAGFAEVSEEGCFNSLAVLQNGSIEYTYRKNNLPNYGVFDERRYFLAGTSPLVIDIQGIGIAFTICEDIWQLDALNKLLADSFPKDMIINISASPFHVGKINLRKEVFSRTANQFNCALAFCNLIGGQDELVFDGRSMLLNEDGEVIAHAEEFAEDLLIADINKTGDSLKFSNVKAAYDHTGPDFNTVSEVYRALVLGTKDYVQKNGFSKVLIGLSGGIDSSLTAAIAVEALGPQNVMGVTMPSRFNSPDTISDAARSAKALGIEFKTIPIADTLDSFSKTLSGLEDWDEKGIAYENLQARIRGTILMSLSNQFGYLVLTTGNKSETAVGYSTLYGDTAGGFAVIKDVPKTLVYELSRYINDLHKRELIPDSVITRPPSAELRPDQKDTDSLPDYDTLDEILKGYVEDDISPQKLIDKGLDAETVKRIIRLVDGNEYKRRQSPPGIKITPKAFGRDRRMPMTNKYK
ncbi:MAG: NAD+ synthase [Sedimentisphaerales bacterium]|nr:NAD+ synthase [Sedimentisphaerales bacterium]